MAQEIARAERGKQMSEELRFDDKVVIITGAGAGLGRSHARLFGSRGAKVLVNDLGGGMAGGGKSSAAADAVVAEVKELGGEAAASYDSVEDGDKIVQAALDHFGRVDVVINNAGILRDTSFHKMSDEDWELIFRVHVQGAYKVTHAAWPHMREQGYGRVLFTTSAAGIYGNFGQANYSAAKLGLVGLSNTLALEGVKKGIHVNTIAPVAGSRLTETVLPPDLIEALKPEYVSPLAAWLCHESCDENGGLFEVGGGFHAKLRWERTEGKTFRVGRNITPELVKSSWGEVESFEDATHPTDVMSSMQPLFANVQAGPSKGGNEHIDVDEALGYEFPEVKTSYDERDVALYALGVGAAQDPTNDKDLQLVFELHQEGFHVLPTYGVIPAINTIIEMAKRGEKAPGQNYGFERILHGEQYTEVMRPLPAHATLTHRTKVVDIQDKGKNALVTSETTSFDEDDNPLIVNRFTAVVRGAGGWGGERVASVETNTPPDRKPDAVIEETIDENAALLYRLSGDWNPLHADPGMAMAFGFERPILHGLCTYGRAGRHVVNSFCDGDPRLFKSIQVRFADPVYPGETLVTEMWKESDTKVVFRCRVKERDTEVITRAAVELYTEIPKDPPKKAKKPAGGGETAVASEEPAGPTSAEVFGAIGVYVEQHPELAQKIATVYQFKLSKPASTWTLDLKNGGGAVIAGGEMKPDCTLALTDADFMDMTSGAADPQQLYFGGKLKISGNVMASQKLEFLQKIDRSALDAAPRATPAPAEAQAAEENAAPAASRAGEFFEALSKRLEQNNGLVAEVGALIHFHVTEPDADWTLDLRSGKGSVNEGAPADAELTLTVDEETLFSLAKGDATAEQLFQRGALRVDGDVSIARRLTFLHNLL
jgi:3-hydroxyacyl-CoA dehydrogenase/3a,7a,12a-trihydroxy-5b-cholest-24-enoyl-CoA hydratase